MGNIFSWSNFRYFMEASVSNFSTKKFLPFKTLMWFGQNSNVVWLFWSDRKFIFFVGEDRMHLYWRLTFWYARMNFYQLRAPRSGRRGPCCWGPGSLRCNTQRGTSLPSHIFSSWFHNWCHWLMPCWWFLILIMSKWVFCSLIWQSIRSKWVICDHVFGMHLRRPELLRLPYHCNLDRRRCLLTHLSSASTCIMDERRRPDIIGERGEVFCDVFVDCWLLFVVLYIWI